MRVAVIITEFADYVKGQVVKIEAEIEKILASHNAGHVVVADHPADEPAKSAKSDQ